MQIVVSRYFSSDKGTLGRLLVNGEPVMTTLELPWVDNKRNVSCIPEGLYALSLHNGKKYKDCLILDDVPNRSAILVHAGNTVHHTQGCILVGDRLTYVNDGYFLANSKLNLKLLMSFNPTSIKVHNTFEV